MIEGRTALLARAREPMAHNSEPWRRAPRVEIASCCQQMQNNDRLEPNASFNYFQLWKHRECPARGGRRNLWLPPTLRRCKVEEVHSAEDTLLTKGAARDRLLWHDRCVDEALTRIC